MKRRWLSFGLLALASVAGAESTTITGERMEMLDKGSKVVFSGDVHLVRGGDDMRAAEMRTNKTRDQVKAKGNVRLVRLTSATETWKGFGDVGYYDTSSGSGYLLGTTKRARLVRTEVLSATATRTIEIVAERIDFFQTPQRALARGKVYGTSTDPETGSIYEFTASEAEFRGEEKRVVLFGKKRPILNQTERKDGKLTTRRVTGDRIIYYIEKRRLISEGSARAVLREEK